MEARHTVIVCLGVLRSLKRMGDAHLIPLKQEADGETGARLSFRETSKVSAEKVLALFLYLPAIQHVSSRCSVLVSVYAYAHRCVLPR